MPIYKTKKWPPLDIFYLKLGSIIFGLLIGAHFPVFVRRWFWVLLAILLLTMMRVTYFYYLKKDDS